jgi:glutamine synthetase
LETPTIQVKELEDLIKTVVDEIFSSFGIRPNIGFELEFYLKHKNTYKKHKIKTEKGKGQYEIALPPSTDILAALREVSDLQHELKTHADLSPKPNIHDYGSALQIHLSLQQHGQNLFDANSCNQNPYLRNYVSIVLSYILEHCYYLLTPECYTRFQAQFMAPTNISWGINNRTTLIRVIQSQGESRRAEFRLPSANCCPYRQTFFLLQALLLSLTNPPAEHALIAPVYGNAFDTQYNLPPLPKSSEEAEGYSNPRFFLL